MPASQLEIITHAYKNISVYFVMSAQVFNVSGTVKNIFCF